MADRLHKSVFKRGNKSRARADAWRSDDYVDSEDIELLQNGLGRQSLKKNATIDAFDKPIRS